MNKIIISLIFSLPISLSIIACTDNTANDNRTYTLYRNAPSTEEARIHVATFDSVAYSHGDELDEAMNKRNCERVAAMFKEKPIWSDINFWCEKGKYRE